MNRLLILTGGGDCPGLNAVIRAIVKRAAQEKDWEIVGCIESFNGVLKDPAEVIILDENSVAGILVKGGTILGTTNKGGPFAYPVQNLEDGSWTTIDRSDEMIHRLQYMGIKGVINIGGDGSLRISKALADKGLRVINVPKTIDNDLSSTDYTFGFQTAVQIATESVDKLVTTAESHNRIFILEVMGRDAGWIALNSAIGGGADVCLIPEIPYDIEKIKEKIETRYRKGRGFCIIVVAEGAMSKDGKRTGADSNEVGYDNFMLGGVGWALKRQLITSGVQHDIRVSLLGHLQRGGTPVAYDRVLACEFGVAAFELALADKWGNMVAYRHPDVIAVPFEEALREPHLVSPDSRLVRTAKGLRIAFGD
jgi:6-phosphofructokinase 1